MLALVSPSRKRKDNPCMGDACQQPPKRQRPGLFDLSLEEPVKTRPLPLPLSPPLPTGAAVPLPSPKPMFVVPWDLELKWDGRDSFQFRGTARLVTDAEIEASQPVHDDDELVAAADFDVDDGYASDFEEEQWLL